MVRFAETDKKISYDEYFSVVNYLNKMLAIGVEMERPCGKAHDIIAKKLLTTVDSHDSSLQRYKKTPANNKFNVNHIINDGSVSSSGGEGVEIVFAGTTENFLYIKEKLAMIETELDKLGCDDYHYSCSNHITAITLQDRALNPIILKNILQICRTFSAGLYWLGAGDEMFGCRQRIANYADPLLSFTPIGKTSAQLRGAGKMHLCRMDKQPLIDLDFENSFLSGLFVEFRNPDGFRVPSAIAANMILFKAIAHKAVELSTQGVLEVDSFDHWLLNKEATKAILDNQLAQLDTLKDSSKIIAKKLIDFVMPQLKSIDSNAIETLQSLADQPVFLRRGNHKEIEKSLRYRINCNLSETEAKIVEIVLSKLVEAKDAKEYRKKIAEKLTISIRMVEHGFTKIKSKTGQSIVYDSGLKAYRIE